MKILGRALVITIVSALLAIVTNLVRSDGIPLFADNPYEIFSECKDAEAVSVAASANELTPANPEAVIYVDARDATHFFKEHVKGAVHIPYSALFGAKPEDIELLKQELRERSATAVAVYGSYADPDDTAKTIDFGKPLAAQLMEAGVKGVRYVEGGLPALKKLNIATVQGKRKTP